MKSFSDDIVTKDHIEAVRSESRISLSNLRRWMFGLAIFNLVITVALVAIAIFHH